ACELLMQCMKLDASNVLYAQAFCENLQQKIPLKKKGIFSGVGKTGSKTQLMAMRQAKKWKSVLTIGWDALKKDPWDASTLMYLGEACEHLDHPECELLYYSQAMKPDANNPEVNRKYARALDRQATPDTLPAKERIRMFEKAMACCQRISNKSGNKDQEARKMLASLSVKKTTVAGGYEEAENTKDVKVNKALDSMGAGGNARRLTREQQLEKELQTKPSDVSAALGLAEIHKVNERFGKAADVLQAALDAGGEGDGQVTDRLEDLRILDKQQLMMLAAQKLKEEKTQERKDAYLRSRQVYWKYKLVTYQQRCDRDEANLGNHFLLATTLEHVNKPKEAIQSYQKAKGDMSKKGETLLGLGRCFEAIGQHKLSLSNYKQAVEAFRDSLSGDKLLLESLYHAGCVAMDGVKDFEAASEYLSQAAEIDFSYKDVADRLDKLADLDNN
ncbi:MAG: hypothetical protein N2C14_15030, partial [Planctomycetales bacterium]